MDDCCSPEIINDLDQHFDKERAEDDALEYSENGLNARGEKMLAYLDSQSVGLKSALDIGCGSGGLHHELLLRNLVKEVQAIDASSAFLDAALSNAQEMGIAEKIDYKHADFALHPEEADKADLMLMDRVICCYPELDGLLAPAIQKSKRYAVISYPKDGLFTRLYFAWKSIVKRLQRSPFRLYYHEPKHIRAIVINEGMQLVDESVEDDWQIDVYERAMG